MQWAMVCIAIELLSKLKYGDIVYHNRKSDLRKEYILLH